MAVYYNEFDEKAAAWLRELIARGLIADGVVDTRSIVDVEPRQLAGFTQCHFFAGIGVWSYALRRAGWPDDRPVWTGSCPCQPFSAAGKGGGFDDERHLWPAWQWLIQQRGPGVVLGEQVASKDAEPWLDLVQADLEGLGYAFGACAFPSAGVGAPHIRDRTYWVADTVRGRARNNAGKGVGAEAAIDREDGSLSGQRLRAGWEGASGGLANNNNNNTGLEGRGQPGRERGNELVAGPGSVAGGLADDTEQGWEPRGRDSGPSDGGGATRVEPRRLRDASRVGDARCERDEFGGGFGDMGRSPEGEQSQTRERQWSGDAVADTIADGTRPAGPTNGLWRDADWLHCRDHKWRPVEPGTFPLAHGATARVVRLRGYGNAVNAEAATVFIQSYLEARGE